MPTYSAGQLEALVTTVFHKASAPLDHAQLVAGHLVEANLMGHDSHGVMRVPQYTSAMENRELSPEVLPTIIHESPAGAVMDGGRGFGQVAAMAAMQHAMETAHHSGVAAVALRNCYHSGRLGAYTELAARHGFIGIVMVNAGGGGQSVVPFGGAARRLATNPFSIAAPSPGEFPIALDIATSTAPEGKVRDYSLRKAQLPEGWIVDAQGLASRDPQDFYGPPAGAVLPLGGAAGHKGFGLAVMIDILAGALSGAGCCRAEEVPARDGLLAIAINVERFGGGDYYYEQVAALVEHLKSCPTAPGFDEVFVPGELEYRQAQRRRETGIPLDDNVWQQICHVAARYGVPPILDAASDGRAAKMHARSPHVSRDELVAS
jgi:uncharacterized oxidoreductase